VRVVDAQLHEPAVTLPWADADDALRSEVMLELQLALMDSVGVDHAVLFPVRAEWGAFAAARVPDRFASVPMITAGGGFGGIPAEASDIEARVEAAHHTAGVVAMRIVRTTPTPDGEQVLVDPGTFDRAVAACARETLPIFMSTAGDLDTPGVLARRHPELRVVVDHVGLAQPPSYVAESPPFRSLPALLALASLPNVFVKWSAAPTLSAERFPFADLWPHLRAVVDAFGAERVMWGSDISRVAGRLGFARRIPRGDTQYAGRHTYAEALLYLRETPELSAHEKEWILGGTARSVLGWP